MNTKPDILLDELIKAEVEKLIQEDTHYQSLATPLKSAAAIKQDHRQQLTEFFKFQQQRDFIEHAQELITDHMPVFVPAFEFKKIKEELDNSPTHFAQFIETNKDKTFNRPILWQEMLGLSNETLLHIFSLGQDLVQKGKFQDALALFTFLTFLAPHVSSYWTLEGICLQKLNSHAEAIAAFAVAKQLDPTDPLPIACSVECYHFQNEKNLAQEEIELLEKVISTLDANERDVWKANLKNLKITSN